MFKEFLYKHNSNTIIINIVPALINTIQIFIFNAIYTDVALRMTNFENHKYFNSYESSLVFKTFCFNFVNTFNSFFLLAFCTSWFPNIDLCLVDPPKNYLDGSDYMEKIYDRMGLLNS